MSSNGYVLEIDDIHTYYGAIHALKGVSLKVSEKGGVSVYGLGRFPVTLYKEQWTKLLDLSDEIRQFLSTHDAELKTKQ